MEQKNIELHQTNFSPETLIALFRRTARLMARSRHRRGHIQHAQQHVLSLLKENGPMIQRDMQDMLQVRSASLSELLAKLEKHGLVAREREERDKRNIVVALTGKGKEAAAEAEGDERESAEAIFASLDGAERRQLGELLVKVVIGLEEILPEHAGRGHWHVSGDEHGHGPHGPGRGTGPGGYGPGARGRGKHGHGRDKEASWGPRPRRGLGRHGPVDPDERA